MYARIKQYKKQNITLGVFHDHHLYFSLPERDLLTVLMQQGKYLKSLHRAAADANRTNLLFYPVFPLDGLLPSTLGQAFISHRHTSKKGPKGSIKQLTQPPN